jgi:hypothetical protein
LGGLPSGEYTGESQLLGDEYTRESQLPDDKYNRESWLPGAGGEYTGESIMNMNNSSNIRKNSKSFLRVSKGNRRSCLMQKPESKIS